MTLAWAVRPVQCKILGHNCRLAPLSTQPLPSSKNHVPVSIITPQGCLNFICIMSPVTIPSPSQSHVIFISRMAIVSSNMIFSCYFHLTKHRHWRTWMNSRKLVITSHHTTHHHHHVVTITFFNKHQNVTSQAPFSFHN